MTRFSPMCACGHDSTQHAPSSKVGWITPRPCKVKGCDCSHFRNVALATKIAKAEEK